MPYGRAWFAKPKDLKTPGSPRSPFPVTPNSSVPFDAYGGVTPKAPIFAKALEEGIDIFAKQPRQVLPEPSKFQRIVETPGWCGSVNPRFNREKEVEHITLCFSTIDRISAFAKKNEGPRPALHFNDANELEHRLRVRRHLRIHAKAAARAEKEESVASARWHRGGHLAATMGGMSKLLGRSSPGSPTAPGPGPGLPLAREPGTACLFWRAPRPKTKDGADTASPNSTRAGPARPWTEGGRSSPKGKFLPFVGRAENKVTGPEALFGALSK